MVRSLPAFLLPFLAAAPAAALDLVRDGRPVAVVVTASPPAPADAPKGRKRAPAAGAEGEADEAEAVRTLVEWVRKITGAELPVVAAAPAGAPAILVGRAAVDAGLGLDAIDSPTREGLRVVADADRVRIAGQSGPATLRAVCRFLEALGCRCFMDGPIGEVYPETKTLSVGPLDIAGKPGLRYRNPKGPSWNGRLWKAWNGAGGDAIDHAHAWGRYVPDALFTEHPGFFAMGRDGQRRPGGWLCTANPDLRRFVAERVVAAVDAGRRNPSISPTDGRAYCQCPDCRAQDDPAALEPSSGAVSMTNRYVDFFDDVARRVAAARPEAVLGFYCYADYTQPPVPPRRLAPSLCAVIAPIRYCRLHAIGHPGCPGRLQQVGMIDAWAACASRLGYYNYTYNLADATLPLCKIDACRREFPFLKQRGLAMMTLEVLSNWYLYGPHLHLALRLAYDPGADADAILEDYWTKFYGPAAAPHMKDYWTGLDAQVVALGTHAGGFFGLAQAFTPEFLALCRGRLDRAAEAAAPDPRCAERVAMHAEGLRNAVEYHAVCDAMARGDFPAAVETLDAMIARIRGLVAKGWANPEYGTAYLERFLAPAVRAGAAACGPPHRVLAVLPETWRFAVDPDDAGRPAGWGAAGFDAAAWPLVHAWTKTLDAQGRYRTGILWYRTTFQVPAAHGDLSLFFAEVDGLAEVYVNGEPVDIVACPGRAPGAKRGAKAPPPTAPAGAAPVKSRVPFEADVTGRVRPGGNVLAVRVDHTKITDLALGGLLRPVVLVEKAE
jgi:hypothetical protein